MIKSVAFPKMFNHKHTQFVEDKDATAQNMRLVLMTEQGEFAYDPFFGINWEKYMKATKPLMEVLQNHIYTQLTYYIPQLSFNRADIRISREINSAGTLHVNITAINRTTSNPNTYEMIVTKGDTL